MKLSPETKKKLIRYANAVKQFEVKSRTLYFPNGELHIPVSFSTSGEWAKATDDLKTCPEPGIKKLVYAIQPERMDAVFGIFGNARLLKIDKISAARRIAENELVALGHKLQGTAVKTRRKTR